VAAIAPNDFRKLLNTSGVTTRPALQRLDARGEVTINAGASTLSDAPRAGDRVRISGIEYEVIEGGGRGRLQVRVVTARGRIGGRVRAHCGYHKCLTEFSKLVYGRTCRLAYLGQGQFEHFHHRADAFYEHCDARAICSVSGNALDLSRFDDIRVARFLRDPRDIVVSAYHYHRSGKEHWCLFPDPTDIDWWVARAKVPAGLGSGESLTDFLNRVPAEEGLLAELDILSHHFQSMREWPITHPSVRLFHYRDVVGNERAVFQEIFEFFNLGRMTTVIGPLMAELHKADGKTAKQSHIRNPTSGQWQKHFTPRVQGAFLERYGDLLERYG
jgi:Sulfotransferase domain